MFLIYLHFLYTLNTNDFWINTGLCHTKNALHKEDLFMAEHLMSQGYKVYMPENLGADKIVERKFVTKLRDKKNEVNPIVN